MKRNFDDRKRWNCGKCVKCEGRVKRMDGGYICEYEYGGIWYICDKCGYTIFLQYYDPKKDICW